MFEDLTKEQKRLSVEHLVKVISVNLQVLLAQSDGLRPFGAPPTISAKKLFDKMSRTPQAWPSFFVRGKDRRPLIKAALKQLKADGKVVCLPVRGRHKKRCKDGTYDFPVVGWAYKWVDNPLDAIAALHPLENK